MSAQNVVAQFFTSLAALLRALATPESQSSIKARLSASGLSVSDPDKMHWH